MYRRTQIPLDEKVRPFEVEQPRFSFNFSTDLSFTSHWRAVYFERSTYGSEGGRFTSYYRPYDPSPSQEDIQVTKRLVECGELIGISLLDHIIIGDHKFVSLKEKGYV